MEEPRSILKIRGLTNDHRGSGHQFTNQFSVGLTEQLLNLVKSLREHIISAKMELYLTRPSLNRIN